MITLIHGPAELLRAEALSEIRARIAEDPALIDANTTQFVGQQAAVAEIRNACDTVPFLAERRLVVVEGLLRQLMAPAKSRLPAGEQPRAEEPALEAGASPPVDKTQSKALLAYLEQVPETADLVFVEDDVLAGGAVLRLLLELQRTGRARIVTCQNPRRNDLPEWIRERARLHRLKLDPAAIADLAEFVGDDLRQLDQELSKLADYAAGGRTVNRADVRLLVTATRAANVFELVEALGLGDARRAGRLMKHALDVDGEQPLRLMGMISRQYRLLIQTKSLQAGGAKPTDIARTLNVQDWTVPKLVAQAERHSFASLQRAMERILAADEAIKTGKLGDREAMDILLAELLES